MRKILFTVFTSLLTCSALSAFWPEAADSALEIGLGYRQDNLQFKTQANPNTYISAYSDGYYSDYSYSDSYTSSASEIVTDLPILTSVLNWKDLNIAFIEGRGKYVTCDNFYIRGGGDYGWICSGHNQDSDFSQLPQIPETARPPKIEYSRSTARTKGHIYDVNFGVGYEFQFCDDELTIAPLIGYSWKGQHLHDSHLKIIDLGSDALADSYPRSGSGYSVDGLHSSYKTRWTGPFVGFDAEYRYNCAWSFVGGYEYHFGQYHAKGDWNLRRDLPKGFKHRCKSAYGHILDFGVKWDFCECWTLAVHGGFQYFRANHGKDRAEINEEKRGDVVFKRFVTQPIKKVQWYTNSISVDIGMVF